MRLRLFAARGTAGKLVLALGRKRIHRGARGGRLKPAAEAAAGRRSRPAATFRDVDLAAQLLLSLYRGRRRYACG